MNYKFDGYFGSTATIITDETDIVDYSKQAWIYAGQNSSFSGMMKTVSEELPFIDLSNKLCLKHGLPKASTYLKGEYIEEKFEQTLSVLALYTYQCSISQQLLDQGIIPHILTGLSIGEYACWVVSGAISFEAMFTFLLEREKISKQFEQNISIIAVLKSAEKLNEQLNGTKFQIANINSSQQSVIAFEKKYHESILEQLNNNHIPFIELADLPVPYHTKFMKGSEALLRPHAKKLFKDIVPPSIPIASFASGKVIERSNFSKATVIDTISKMMITQANFVNQTYNSYQYGARSFVEISPRKNCLSFVRNILASNKHARLIWSQLAKSTETTSKVLELNGQQSLIFKTLQKIISVLTGHELESITIEDRFQDDLNIDSIKKAEIIVSMIEEGQNHFVSAPEVQDFESIKETVEYFASLQNENNHDNKIQMAEKHFQLFTHEWVETNKYSNNTFKEGLSLQELKLSQNSEMSSDTIYTISAPNEYDSEILYRFVRKLDHFLKNNELNLIFNPKTETPFVIALHALFLSLKKESNSFQYKFILSDNNETTIEEFFYPFDLMIKYVDKKRFVKKLIPIPQLHKKQSSYNQILALGGAKGITRKLLEETTVLHQSHLIVVGRSKEVDLKSLEEKYPTVKYFSLDTTSYNEFKNLKNNISSIDLVINGVGVERSELLANTSLADFELQLKTKIKTVKNIQSLFANQTIKLINFSSFVSFYGNQGQCAYSYANAYISNCLNDSCNIKAINIHWPAWDNVGMTASTGITEKLKLLGLSPIPIKEGVKAFEWAISSGEQTDLYVLESNEPKLLNASMNNKTLRSSKEMSLLNFHTSFAPTVNSYLSDHQIGQHILLPAATALTYFYLFSYAQQGCDSLFFRDFKVNNPLFISGETKAQIGTINTETEPFYYLKSKAVNFSCYQSEIKSIKEFSLPLESTKTMNSKEIYKKLFHRPKLQFIKKLKYTDSVYQYEINDEVIDQLTGNQYFNNIFALFEAAMQAHCFSSYLKFEEESLPFMITDMVVHPQALNRKAKKVIATQLRKDQKSYLSDINIFCDEGQLLAQLNGATSN